MRVFELNRDGGEIAKAVHRSRDQEAERTGVHCSSIIRDLQERTNPKKYGKGRSDIGTRTLHLFQEVGNVIEDLIAEGLARRAGWEKPAPRTYRGIVGSPDGWSARTRTIHEIKATWVSERAFVELDGRGRIVSRSDKFHWYMVQSMFYAAAWDAERILLHVLFINGNYRPPFPNSRTFVIKATEQEREQNFMMLRQHAEDLGWLKAA